jgi:hypothetical protein
MTATSDHPRYRAPTLADEDRARSAGLLLDNHRLARDGIVWRCVHCESAWSWPQPIASAAAPCVSRRWGDQ